MKPSLNMSKSTDPKNNISVSWSSPSNIALIKYWGKHGRQLPRNASISFTLDNAKSITRITMTDLTEDRKTDIEFLFEGQSNPEFAQRISNFIASITEAYFPFLKCKHLKIESSNTFPHSSGIASSASAMSALALCLCDLELQISEKSVYDHDFYQKASLIARLGSGSAARSVYPYVAVWGNHNDVNGSSDLYAISVNDKIHSVFKDFHDDILIISDAKKHVSSTVGHQLMDNNPYATVRYKQANSNFTMLLTALKTGDIATFGKITEDEALTLHALMMCSDPSFILMEPRTLEVINKIRSFRQKTGIHVYFTLDAGPNVHVLYPHSHADEVKLFISNDLIQYCQNGQIIFDQTGNGPVKLA